jgi:hypothetical protein
VENSIITPNQDSYFVEDIEIDQAIVAHPSSSTVTDSFDFHAILLKSVRSNPYIANLEMQ